MLAAILYGPNDLRVEQAPEPRLPTGGLVVETAAVGICGSDVRNWRQGSPRLKGPQVLGHEVAGTVSASDSPVFPVGTPVGVCPGIPCLRCGFCRRGLANMCPNRQVLAYDLPGGMAERFAVPAAAIASGSVVAIPARIPLTLAPLAETLHTILNGQDRAAIGMHDSVLVLGLGPVGVLHAAVAAGRGASPILAVDPAAGRVEAAARILGPDHVMRLEEGWQQRATDRTGGEGWDVVIVANPAPAAIANAMELVAPVGRILAFAGVGGPTPIVGVDISRVHYRQVSIIGAFGGTPLYYERAVRWLAETSFPVAELVTARLPLSDAVEGFARVERGEGLKTMLYAGSRDVT
jgi:L-iditol 2-dehydrogenase